MSVLNPRARSVIVCIGLMTALAAHAAAQTPSLSLSGASGAPGATVTVDVGLELGGGAAPASVQWDLTYSPSDLSLVTGTYYATGAAASGAGKSADCNSISAGDVRCIVSGMNTTAIGSGTLATLTFKIAAGTTDTSTPVSLVSPVASDGNANALGITASGDTVTISGAAQTITFGALGNVAFGVAPFSLYATSTSGLAVVFASTTTGVCTVVGNVVSIVGTGPCSITASQAGNTNYAAATPVIQAFTVTDAVVSPISVSPGAGGATTQAFTFTFQDPNGFADLSVVDVLINNSLDGIGACYVAFAPASATSGYLYLVDDAGDGGYAGGSPISLPSSGNLQNSQCTIDGTGSSVSASGNTLTLTLAITFAAGFSGNKIFYTAAASSSQNSGWQALGTWDVPGAAPAGPAVGGVIPARSATTGGTYAFTFTDTNGYADLAVVDVLTNNFLNGVAACYVAFAPASATSGYLYLVDDSGDGGYASGSPITLPSSGSLQNSQCTISGTGSAVAASGNTLTLTLAITFNSSFAGNQVFYLAALNNSAGNSGWQAVGSVTVP